MEKHFPFSFRVYKSVTNIFHFENGNDVTFIIAYFRREAANVSIINGTAAKYTQVSSIQESVACI